MGGWICARRSTLPRLGLPVCPAAWEPRITRSWCASRSSAFRPGPEARPDRGRPLAAGLYRRASVAHGSFAWSFLAPFSVKVSRGLGSHCFAYIHATEVGGTHPALIEAMGRGALTLYLDTPENAEWRMVRHPVPTRDNLTQALDRCSRATGERESWRERRAVGAKGALHLGKRSPMRMKAAPPPAGLRLK